jgi:rare lipoprotein A
MKIINTVFMLVIFLLSVSCSTINAQSPDEATGFSETGKASFYAAKYQSRTTASGEKYDQNAKTAAHRTLPFGTRVKVTNVENGKSVVVKINDRGPFVKGRIIDLSKSAFKQIGETALGVIKVRIEVI